MICTKFDWNWPTGSGEEDFLKSSMYFHFFVITSPWKREESFIKKNLNSLLPRMICAKFGWRRFFKFVSVFEQFRNYLNLEKYRALHLNKLESPSPKDALCQVWLKLAQLFWRRSFFFKFVNNFRYFVIISPWKRAGPFIWTNLNPLHSRMLCDKFGWNWPSGSGEEDFFFKFVNVFSLFRNYLPLEKDRALHFKKLESPLSKIALWQVWFKLAQRFWRRSSKCEKFTDGQTDDRQQVIRKAHLSFQLRWAKTERDRGEREI